MTSRTTLRDGRSLAYAEYGDPQGAPVFYFHGWPSSRLEAQVVHPAAAAVGARIVAVDRPGMGLSDFKPGRTLADWPDDLCELADTLQLDRFAVLGFSGGGPYVAVCALRIPHRLTSAAIVCGVGPFEAPKAMAGMMWRNRFIFLLVRHMPRLSRLVMGQVGRQLRRNPRWAASSWISGLPAPDKAVLANPALRQALVDSYLEALRQGPQGAVWEANLYSRSWGFRLEDIAMEIHLWQGDLDVNVPPAMARYQASSIPRCRATFYPGESHLSLPVNHARDILNALLPNRIRRPQNGKAEERAVQQLDDNERWRAGMEKRNGFTLIEMLIVAAIIGVLCAIAIPV